MSATIRKDLIEDGLSVPVIDLSTMNPCYISDKTIYECHQPDSMDHCEYNIIILTDENAYLAHSIDFDFIED